MTHIYMAAAAADAVLCHQYTTAYAHVAEKLFMADQFLESIVLQSNNTGCRPIILQIEQPLRCIQWDFVFLDDVMEHRRPFYLFMLVPI